MANEEKDKKVVTAAIVIQSWSSVCLTITLFGYSFTTICVDAILMV